MSKVRVHISTSLDGYVAGPNQSQEEPLGEGGERLHDWLVGLRAWREHAGMEGGEENVSGAVFGEEIANVGAEIMGRGKFGPAARGPWGDDPWRGWWAEDPPFHKPVFVLTHETREPDERVGGTTFTFVDGIENALDQARAAAGERDVAVGGGAQTIQQFLRAGLLDEMRVHVAPLLLGGGLRLFEDLDGPLEVFDLQASASPAVAHLRFNLR